MIKESDPNKVKPEEYAAMLDKSAARLKRAAAVIRNEYDDAIGWGPSNDKK